MKYFSTLRPVSIGTYPMPQGNHIDAIVNFDEPIFVAEIGRPAWGYIEYAHPLTAEQAAAYELIKGKEEQTMYDWAFTPDAADIARNKGYNLGVTGGKTYDTESKAIWHGKQWLKTTGRTGTITAVPAESRKPVCIFDC